MQNRGGYDGYMLRGHEAYELNELLMGCVNTINNIGVFINQAKDQELKKILQNQLEGHIQDYNIKVQWVESGSSSEKLTVPAMPAKTSGGTPTPQAVTPNPNGTTFDDRAIATSYLISLKSAGKNYASAAFEADDPNLRQFLEDAFTMSSHHAFEVANWMAKKGYYPGEQASNSYLQALKQTYNPVLQPVGAR